MAAPLTLTRLIETLVGFFGMMILARLGHHALAASALLYSLQVTIFIVGISLLLIISIFVSRHCGAKEYSQVGYLVREGWILALILSLLVMLLYHYLARILLFFHQPKALVNILVPYFNVVKFGIPANFLSVVCSQFLIGTKRQKIITVIAVYQTTTYLCLGYALVLGHFGAARHGLVGWAWAYIITFYINLTILLLVILLSKSSRPYKIFTFKFSRGFSHIKRIIHIGWPVTTQATVELLGMTIVTIMAGWIGADALIVVQIVTQYVMLMIIPTYGFRTTAGILVGHAMGAKNYLSAKKYGYANIIACMFSIVVFVLCLNIFPEFFIKLFLKPTTSHYHHLLLLLREAFLILAATQIFNAARTSLTGCLYGVLSTRYAMFVSVAAIWVVRVPLAYVFGFLLHGGVLGIMLGSLSGAALCAILMLWRWYSITKSLLTK